MTAHNVPSKQIFAKIGHGTVVHILDQRERFGLCGAGFCSTGSRRNTHPHIVNGPATCEKCLRIVEQAQSNNQG